MIATDKPFDSNNTIVARGEYDYDKHEYKRVEVNAAQVSEMIVSNKYLETQNASMKSGIASVKEYLIESLSDESIDTDVAQEIAERLGIELVKNVRVEFTVRYSATVNVPLDYDLDDSDFDTHISYTGESADFIEEDWEIEDFSAHQNY